MKRNKIALAATSGLVGLSVLVGSMAFAQTTAETKEATTDAAELQMFLDANPTVAAVIAKVEAKAGGKIVDAEFDDEKAGNSVVEFEVVMADGSEKDVLYTLADGSMTVDVDDDSDESDESDDDQDEDGDTETEAGETETGADK